MVHFCTFKSITSSPLILKLHMTFWYFKYNKPMLTVSSCIEWMMHLYSALLCIAVHPKCFTIMCGGRGLSSTPNSVQNSLGWCDGCHSTIPFQNGVITEHLKFWNSACWIALKYLNKLFYKKVNIKHVNWTASTVLCIIIICFLIGPVKKTGCCVSIWSKTYYISAPDIHSLVLLRREQRKCP